LDESNSSYHNNFCNGDLILAFNTFVESSLKSLRIVEFVGKHITSFHYGIFAKNVQSHFWSPKSCMG
jgi:hypothetical protein